ncbi:CorA family divalent cation transporter [Streptomyces sp. NPDC002758]
MSDFLLVDIQLPPDVSPDEPPLSHRLGIEAEHLTWFGRAGEPVRADFLGDRAAFVVPTVDGNRIAHLHALVTERHLITVHRGAAPLLDSLTGQLGQERPSDTVAVMFLLLREALETFRRAAIHDLLLVEDLEDEMFEKRRPEQVYRLAQLRRRAALLHHSLLPNLVRP